MLHVLPPKAYAHDAPRIHSEKFLSHWLTELDKLKFVPETLSVNVGAIVEWDNAGIAPHNITFDPPNSSLTKTTFNAGEKWQMKFTSAGTYAYTCTIHPGMVGTITVAPAGS